MARESVYVDPGVTDTNDTGVCCVELIVGTLVNVVVTPDPQAIILGPLTVNEVIVLLTEPVNDTVPVPPAKTVILG